MPNKYTWTAINSVQAAHVPGKGWATGVFEKTGQTTGVLSLNMVDTMSHLPQVREAAVELGKTVSFDPGARYADFDAKTDHMADYGLAGLVAAGAGVLAATKLGFLAVILLFLKKGFAVLIAAGLGAIAWFRRKFRAAEE